MADRLTFVPQEIKIAAASGLGLMLAACGSPDQGRAIPTITPTITPTAAATPRATETPRSAVTPQGAINCEVAVQSDAYIFIDMFRFNSVGRPGKIDPEDITTGVATNMSLQLRRTRDQQEVFQERYLVQTDKQTGQQVSRAFVKISDNCDANNGTAAIIYKNISDNPADKDELIIRNRTTRTTIDGRELTSIDQIRRFAQNMPDSNPNKRTILNGLQDENILNELRAKSGENRTAMGQGTPVAERPQHPTGESRGYNTPVIGFFRRLLYWDWR